MKLFSIIIPVYKVEQFLERCVDSVLSQTHKDFELILVDDGSPDHSGELCDRYANQDQRITVIHQENGGVSIARNRGLDVATGRYVAFVDADDLIPVDFLENAYAAIQKYPQADLVQFAWHAFEEGAEVCTDSIADTSLQQHENISAMRDFLKYKTFSHAPWGKMIHRDLLCDIRFPAGIRVGEDLYVSYQLLGKAKNIISTNAIGYYYCIREGSAMTSRNPGAVENALWVFDQMYAYYQREYPALEQEAATRYAGDLMQLLRDLDSMEQSDEKSRVNRDLRLSLKRIPAHLLAKKTALLKQLALWCPPLYFLIYKMMRR